MRNIKFYAEAVMMNRFFKKKLKEKFEKIVDESKKQVEENKKKFEKVISE